MNDPGDTERELQRLDDLYRAKARAEVDAAEKLATGTGVVRGQGDVLADVLLVKGEPGPGDLAKKRALAGEDGSAIGRALDALGVSSARYAVCTRVGATGRKRLTRLRLLTEAIDPRIVVLLDAQAAEDFAAAYGVVRPAAGSPGHVLGRVVLAVDDFEASLGDETRKRQVWAQLRTLRAPDRSWG